jgi:radical SAM protein with 4Fe4S-binding SPASM domain
LQSLELGAIGRSYLKKFKKIYIEITNRCNLSCSFCATSLRPKAFMAPTNFQQLLQRITGYTDYLSLHVLGEPLLHPDLSQFLDLCHHHGLSVNLSTNGTLLAQNRAMLLSKPAVRQLNISLHSFASPEHEQGLDRYLSEVLEFVGQANAATPMFVNLRLWNLLMAGENEERQGNERILRRLEAFFSLPREIAGALTPGQGMALAPRIFLSQDRQFTWPHEPGPDMGRHGFCRGVRDHIAILVDGTVVPCCLDAEANINLGNLLRQPLDEILAGPRAVSLREGFLRQQLHEPLCRRCTYRQRFQTGSGW